MYSNRLMRFFDSQYHLMSVCIAAYTIDTAAGVINSSLPESPEKSAGLRKLLEARDCFMRAHKETFEEKKMDEEEEE